jgi:catechol 2,3-dioxygenase-like lactoylglutathione lyase family enzyme
MNVGMTIRALLLVVFLTWRPTESSPALARIAHVVFRVNDVQKFRDFYAPLGFRQAFEFTDPGKPRVSYIKINDRQFIELYGSTDTSQPTGLLHVCYEATDIEALWNEYRMRGLDPPPARKARAGNVRFLFQDPEGQKVDHTQYLPGSLHSEDGKHLGNGRISQHLVRAVIAVQDARAEHLFYTAKLGFQDGGTSGAIRMRLPGN